MNAKWSHKSGYLGWTQFRIVSKRRVAEGVEIELMAVCEKVVRFWIPQATLKIDSEWYPGWK